MPVNVERHHDAVALNAIVNDPHVRPWVAPGREPLDLTVQVANDNNVVLMGEHGCCMFLKVQPGIYEVHTQVRKAGRGAWTEALTRACGHWMFLRTDACEIVTRVPHGHLGAKAAAIDAGMRYEFTRYSECLFRGRMTDVHIFSIRLQEWLALRSPRLIEAGRKFHGRLHAEADRLGVTDEAHDDDENHNLVVGAAIEMLRAGMIAKALLTYNRWAVITRHEPIVLLSINPVVVKIDHGLIVTFGTDDFEVSR